MQNDLSSNLRQFDDDCLLYRVISCEDNIAKFQRDLNTSFKWSQLWQLKFNIARCVTLKCYRIQNPVLTDYSINNHKLQSVEQHSHLGIVFDQVMSLIPHACMLANSVTSKATGTLNFI